MPHIDSSQSDEDMSDIQRTVEQSTPPPIVQRAFSSKADVMSGVAVEGHPDYDFDEDSDDSDLEIYGKVKPLPAPGPSHSIADTNEEDGIRHNEPSQELGGPFHPGHLHQATRLDAAAGTKSISQVPQLGKAFDETSFLEGIDSAAASEVDYDRQTDEDEDTEGDDTVSIKSEDSQEDTESIHYDDGDDEECSTIAVAQPDNATTLTAPVLSATSTKPGTFSGMKWLKDAPLQARDLVDRWTAIHGWNDLPCANYTNPYYVKANKAGAKAIWLHVSGERLTPTIYRLPDLGVKPGQLDRRMLVVQGPTQGPYIVCCELGGSIPDLQMKFRRGKRYRVWLGLESPQADGFEPGEASVWKSFTSDVLKTRNQGELNGDGAGRQQKNSTVMDMKAGVKKKKKRKKLPVTSVSSISAQKQTNLRVRKVAESMPESLRSLLEEWMAVYGRKPPPCVCQLADSLLHWSSRGVPATWWHVSGERLEPSLHSVDYNKGGVYLRVLVMQSTTMAPFIVRWFKNVGPAIGYRIWNGLTGHDDSGFESGCSVFKVTGPRGSVPSASQLRTWGSWQIWQETKALKPATSVAKTSVSSTQGREMGGSDVGGTLRDSVKGLRPRDSMTALTRFSPSSMAETRQAHRIFSTTGKRKREDENDGDAESLLNSFMSPSAEKIVRTAPANSAELLEHMYNNIVLLFFSKHDGSPRIRLLGACNSVHKVFAQALAGDAFGNEAGSGTKVLSLTLGGTQRKSRNLVEEDEEDYEDLMTTLKGLGCWVIEDGLIRGSLTVEVRAK